MIQRDSQLLVSAGSVTSAGLEASAQQYCLPARSDTKADTAPMCCDCNSFGFPFIWASATCSMQPEGVQTEWDAVPILWFLVLPARNVACTLPRIWAPVLPSQCGHVSNPSLWSKRKEEHIYLEDLTPFETHLGFVKMVRGYLLHIGTSIK